MHLLDGGHHPSRARQGLIRCAWLQDDYAAIKQHAQALLAADPDNFEVLLDLARAHRGQGRYDEATALFNHALARETERSLRHNLFGSAVTAFRSGQQLTTALTFLNRLLQESDREEDSSPYPHLL
ncbi:tetratricopeptide repeat protein [Deinococcus oregonensis]|uniref:Tetratricopeptide repeat protein n=1 Tax=Deinococcus oregonensis TaxID=1805970 RepID=A0ABV6B0U3_9DEIO